MPDLRHLPACVLAALTLALGGAAQTAPVLTTASKLLGEARAAQGAKDLAGARSRIALAIDGLRLAPEAATDDGQRLLEQLATFAREAGQLAAARRGREKLLALRLQALADDDPRVQSARLELAVVLHDLGEFAEAIPLERRVVEIEERTLPADHADLLAARRALGVSSLQFGDYATAREQLERVLEISSRKLEEDNLELNVARLNLGSILSLLGESAQARSLFERVLASFKRTLPADHPYIQGTRLNLAVELAALGDLEGALALQEAALETSSRTLPDDHRDLQIARENMAATLYDLGRAAQARPLAEKVLAVREKSLAADSPELQRSRRKLATILKRLDQLPRARELEEQSLEVLLRTLPEDHPDLLDARENYANTLADQGELAQSRAQFEQLLEARKRTRPADDPDLRRAEQNLCGTLGALAALGLSQADDARLFGELSRSFIRGWSAAAREALLAPSAREADERCSELRNPLDLALSCAAGLGVFPADPALEREAFVFSETARAAALVSARLQRSARGLAEYGALQDELAQSRADLTDLARSGAARAELDRALERRDLAERKLLELARTLPGGAPPSEIDPQACAARLGEREALVAFRRYERVHFVAGSAREKSSVCLCAFVLRRSKAAGKPASLVRVELGPLEAIAAAVDEWRLQLGAGSGRGRPAVAAIAEPGKALESAGTQLRRLVLDPLLPGLGDAERLIVIADDVLNLVPLDALGGRFTMLGRSTLAELSWQELAPQGSPLLLALGDADFGAAPQAQEPGFGPLPATGPEVRGIALLFGQVFKDAGQPELLLQLEATRTALFERARRARFLHVATHGWFAPDSIRCVDDPTPLDLQSGLGARTSHAERVRGASPMVLCGLALAGANLPRDPVGRDPGRVTAEELADCDLSNCELAVLSACETNVGTPSRAGQGVASLQRALQMAGARSVITSLWSVPDEATKELMLDFYRRMWVEKKPKWQALAEAKRRLREAKDAAGKPRYTMRDWAAWVLTGAPD